MTGLMNLFKNGLLQRQKEAEMTERELETESGSINIDRETDEPPWMRCTIAQWEKKAELSQLNGEMGEALKYADYANCREMYDNGLTVKEIQGRFNHE